MRKSIIAGNWKMNKTATESIVLLQELIPLIRNVQEVEVVLCPPFTSLWVAKEMLQDTNILLGAQNLYDQNEGAYTGEVSASMLQNMGCHDVIIGHSERRELFQEDSILVAKKAKQAIRYSLRPILCVGENHDQRETGLAMDIVKEELEAVIRTLKPDDFKNIIIAYEPIWAIGTGKSATPEDANEMIRCIREYIRATLNENIANSIHILYGGSVKPENIQALMNQSDIDGALVGGASLDAMAFSQIVRFAV